VVPFEAAAVSPVVWILRGSLAGVIVAPSKHHMPVRRRMRAAAASRDMGSLCRIGSLDRADPRIFTVDRASA